MSSDGTNTLSKSERICSKKDISKVLSAGKFMSVSGFRYCFLPDNGAGFCRILVSVPKRNFKRAVRRNLLKRRIRESYRLQKSLVSNCSADIFFIYTGRQVMSFDEIYSSVGAILKRIGDEKDQ